MAVTQGADLIGVSTIFYGFGGIPLVEKVGKILNAFEAAEVPALIQVGASRPERNYTDIVRELTRLGQEVEVKFSIHQSIWLPSADFYINIASSDERMRRSSIESLKKSIVFARDIGASQLSFHAGYATDMLTQAVEYGPLDVQNNVPYADAYRNSISSMIELLEYAEREVRLSIENSNYRPERRYMFSLPEDFDRLPENIGVILNSGHVYYSSKRLNSPEYAKKIMGCVKERVMEMHVNDNDGSEDQHKLVGYGRAPIEQMIEQVSMNGKVPNLIIEAHQRRHHYLDSDLVENIKTLVSLEETVRKSFSLN